MDDTYTLKINGATFTGGAGTFVPATHITTVQGNGPHLVSIEAKSGNSATAAAMWAAVSVNGNTYDVTGNSGSKFIYSAVAPVSDAWSTSAYYDVEDSPNWVPEPPNTCTGIVPLNWAAQSAALKTLVGGALSPKPVWLPKCNNLFNTTTNYARLVLDNLELTHNVTVVSLCNLSLLLESRY